MKRIYLLLLTGIMIAGIAGAQVTVTGADAATNAASPFTTLRAAFVSINSSAQTGNAIIITITANTTETASALLNQSAGPWASMSIRPGTGATVTISGAIAVPLIDLDGADNVIIDGSNNGITSKDLTISNTDLGGTAIRYINDATANTVKNCIIQSVNASPASGTILFSTSTGTSGNSSNIVNNCNIRDGATVPVNAVYSSGSVGAPNGSNTISGCSIFNFSGSGVLVSSTGAGNGWTINPTSFYQTANRTTALVVISIQGGNGHSVLNNNIGGSASDRSGNPLATTSTFNAISLNVGTATATSVQGNFISNLNISGGSGQTAQGINVTGGNVNIGTITGNTIGGGANAYDTIRFNYDSRGIYNIGSGTLDIENNTIGNIAYYNNGGDELKGIKSTAGINTIRNNIVRDMKSNASSGSSFFLSGIDMLAATAGNLIEGNQVYNLTQRNGTGGSFNVGIYTGSLTSGEIRKNKIYSIDGLNAASLLYGIYKTGGSATYSNNMISINPASATLNHVIGGIRDDGSSGSNNWYHNSVSILGTSGAGANNTHAFIRTGTATADIKNNVFSNARTGGSAFHVAIANTNAAATGWSATASDNNDLYSANSGTVAQWLGSGAGNNLTFAGWKAAQPGGSGGDAASVSVVPGFVSATNLHIDPNAGYVIDNLGTTVLAVAVPFDIDGDVRSGATPDPGADEFTGIAPTLDVSAQAITGIPASNCPNNSVPLSVTVKNETGVTLDFSANNMTITLNITGASTQTLTATLTTGTLGAGVSQSYLLSPNADLSANGTHNFAASLTLTGETNTGNNTVNASKAINGTASVTLPQSVDFTGYTGTNLTALFPNWSEATGTTLPAGTTSAWANQSGWSPANTTASINLFSNAANEWIVGPKFTATANTQLHFDAAITDLAAVTADAAGMQGTDDKVVVKISTDCGATFSDLYTFNAANTVSLTNILTAQSISLSAYAGQSVIIAFFASDGPTDDLPDYDFHIDNINILEVFPIDAGATTLALPAASGCYSTTETVSVTVKNYGSATLDFTVTPLTVTTNVTGAATASLSGTLSTGTLAPNATVNVPMSTTLNMTAAGTYTFNASATITGDGNAGNNAMAPVNRTLLSIGGTYTVGSGGNYATLTAAAAAYNAATCITAPVIFSLTDASYSGSETFPITINANGSASSVNTLTIRPASGVTATISGSSAAAIIKLNGADYVTIDGSNNGTATKDLSIENTNTGGNSAVVWIASTASDGATNITVKNIISKGNGPGTTYAGIIAGGSVVDAIAETANTNLVIQNNTVIKSLRGIASAGNTGGQTGTVISGNTIGSATATDYIGKIGISISNSNGASVNNNNIFNIVSTEANPTGIFIGGGVTNTTFNANRIDNLRYTGPTGYGGKGMDVNTNNASSSVTISNNMISNIGGDGWSSLTGDAIVGIRIGATGESTTTTGGINLYYNTVNLTGSFAGNGSGTSSAALYISSTATALDIRNNIFANSLDNTNATDKSWAINSAGANTAFTNINNNDYWVSGAAGVLGFLGGDNVNLAAIQTSFGGNTNSQNAQPTFISATDLHLVATDVNNYVYLESKGVVVSPTTDFDNQSRPNGSAPDIGADEFVGVLPACVIPAISSIGTITTTGAVVNFTCVSCVGTYIVEYGVATPNWSPGTGATAGSGSSAVVTGGSSPISLAGLLTAGMTYKVYVRQVCAGSSYSNNSDSVKFNTLCNATNIPYLERFDAVTAPAVPVCVIVENVNGASQTWKTVGTDFPVSSPNIMRVDDDGAIAKDDWFYTQGLNLTASTSYRLRFQYRNSDGLALIEKLEVKFGTGNNSGAMTSGTLFTNTNIDSDIWTEVSVDFTPSSTGVYYIGFHAMSDANQGFLAVDNVNVLLTPTCEPPINVTVNSVSSTGAVISFTSPGSVFYLEYGAPGFTPGTGAIAGGGTVIGPNASSPINITGLTGETVYDVYVRRDCSGTFSPNTLPTSFTTGLINDDAPGAYTLTVGAGCTGALYTNTGATASAGETTYNAFPSCSGIIGAPVWFKFVAPASGAVRISTDIGSGNTLTDSKVALFSASNVNDYATFSIYSCDEDGGSALGSGYMSVVYATGLTGSTTYYIAVDRFNEFTSSGTFCIAVDELSSTMLATTNTCTDTYQTPLGSNAAYAGWQPLVDASSKLVALVRNPTGGEVNNYSVSQNINTAAVRIDATSEEYYLDRNFMINNSGGATNVDVKLFFLHSELTALQAADPVVTLANLGVTRQTGTTCDNDFIAANGTNSYLDQNGNGSVNGADWIQFNTPAFSKFYLHTSKAPVTMKTFLQGDYNAGTLRHNEVTAQWVAVLNAGSYPAGALSHPYSGFGHTGTESVSPGFFTATVANTDVVDWVLVELRSAAPPAAPIATRAAFILEDGAIVDLDKVSSVAFRGVPNGNYFVTIRHRNHLGIRTAAVQVLDGALGSNPAPTVYDFSTALTQAYDDPAILTNEAMALNGSIYLMWAGNVNQDLFVRAISSAIPPIPSDAAAILTILSGNPSGTGTVYSAGDVNMDGRVRATSSAIPPIPSDAAVILSTPLSGNNNATRREHK